MTRGRWSNLGPGLLVAATGVGAGDLATAAFSGGKLGLTVLWAVLLGALFKYVINEGLARWQLATGSSVLEGAAGYGRRWLAAFFVPYLLVWSFCVGASLISACGIAGHALFPIFDDPDRGKIFFGVLHAVAALLLVWRGGFALFERIMSVCIVAMFVIVVVTAVLLAPPLESVLRGALFPSASNFEGEAFSWSIALIGGVGGTLTILCYGYWIREKQRVDSSHLPDCRLDLGLAYTLTALFGVAMVVIGSQVPVTGSGSTLIVDLSQKLEGPLGPAGRWAFLIGAWGAIFSSTLGVLQSIPFVYADTRRILLAEKGGVESVSANSVTYRVALVGLALVPLVALNHSFVQVQKVNAVVGAFFVPLLGVTLCFLLRKPELGDQRSGKLGTAALLIIVLFFAGAGVLKTIQKLG